MSWFRNPIKDGVRAGLESVFAPEGPATQSLRRALDVGLAPVRLELERLRAAEARMAKALRLISTMPLPAAQDIHHPSEAIAIIARCAIIARNGLGDG